MQFYLIHFPFSLLECKNSPVLICNRTRLDLWKFIPLVSVTPWTTHILHPTHLHTERWFAGPQPFQILNSIQPLYCKLGLLIIKVPKVTLHHVPKPSAPLRKSINKRTLKEPAIKYNLWGYWECSLIYLSHDSHLVGTKATAGKKERRTWLGSCASSEICSYLLHAHLVLSCFFTSSTILHLHTSKILHSRVLHKFLCFFHYLTTKKKYITNRKLISGRDQGENVCWLCGKRNKENKLGRRCKCTNMKRKHQLKQFTDFSKKINATVFLFINNWLLDDYRWSIMYLRRAAIMAVLLIQNLNIPIFYILQESNVFHTNGFKNNCLIITT